MLDASLDRDVAEGQIVALGTNEAVPLSVVDEGVAGQLAVLRPAVENGDIGCDLPLQEPGRAVDLVGPTGVGIGTDLCQDQPDRTVEWMRTGRWTKAVDYGEGSAQAPGFPPMPDWFADNRDLDGIRGGLLAAGLDCATADGVMGGNWLSFFDKSFGAAAAPPARHTRAAE